MSSAKRFECIEECSQCCVEREYYPSVEFGKIGVLILPEEKKKIEELARKENLEINILPRIGVSDSEDEEPEVLAYQLMGIEENGNTCPFLDTASDARSPHGGFTCKIYDQRPLACRAYPVIESQPLELDSKCKFCKECGQADSNLESELESLIQIKNKMNSSKPYVWRYATGIGDNKNSNLIQRGWQKS
ncbi:zinc/iron-chelating domain-containing protein [Nitrosopumilus sp. b1]|uniref:YkgJ family cysteine cluster protein n=1 Tax=Nitrosopumilus sp. b1 TaxID=2109907 RepID=UPI0015F657F7|nr:YkgJ family cysteine cluster protein [Nitrosopumilus sp. b1]KAF6242219.1 zinc/iron-chelating domain-containing protein [Nitrosopumilus sp. b1]